MGRIVGVVMLLFAVIGMVATAVACSSIRFGDDRGAQATIVAQEVQLSVAAQRQNPPQQVVYVAATAAPVGRAVVQQQPASNGGSGGCPSFQKEVLGIWVYQGQRPAYPSPAGRCQVILVDGDITNANTCRYKVFGEGQAVGNLGNGSFEMVRLTGSPDEINGAIRSIASDLAAANGGCPRI